MSQDAFEQLVRRHGPGMLVATRRLLRDETAARDALCAAFEDVSRSVDRFAEGEDAEGRLHRLALDAALRWLRERGRPADETIDDLLPTFLEDGHHARHPEEWRSPDEPAAVRAVVLAAIDRLPESHRIVVLLRDVEGLREDEVAQALGLTHNRVRVRLHRARQALRTLLEPRFTGEH